MPKREATPEDCENQFARLMTLLREGRMLSQGDLAKRLGKSRSVVSFFESFRRPLKSDEFPAWADALGVEAADIEALRLFSFGYRPRGDEWTFWLDFEDPELYEYGLDDPEEVHEGIFDDLASLLNRMAGREICRRNGREDGDDNGDGLRILLPRDYDRRTMRLFLASEPFLGDPNNETQTRVQGTRDDLEALLADSTDEQVALTAAFIRGLHAQARSRLRTRTKAQ